LQKSSMLKVLKPVSILLLIAFSSEVIIPVVSYADTERPHQVQPPAFSQAGPSLIVEPSIEVKLPLQVGGPAQPEFGAFTPVSVSDMVDPFSGDFSYNIPLMDVDGYPVNLAYHSGRTMDEEATWVGLGWSLNMGAINRIMRGIPDEFKGDPVIKESNIKENSTWGVKTGFGGELVGLKKGKKPKLSVGLDFNLGLFYNSYSGLGFEFGASPSISAASKGGLKGGLGMGLGYNSHEGVSTSINGSLSGTMSSTEKGEGSSYTAGTSVSTAYNSRSGMKSLAVNTSLSIASLSPGKNEPESSTITEMNGQSSIPLGTQSFIPPIQMPMTSRSGSIRVTVGGEIKPFHLHASVEGYFSKQELSTHSQTNPAYGYLYSEAGSAENSLLDINHEKEGVFTENSPNLPVTAFTHDLFSVSGHGVSGTFRAFRNDVGVLFDAKQESDGTGNNFGAEIGLGDLAHVAVNYSYNYSLSQSTKWSDDNPAASTFAFVGPNPAKPLSEPFYFKEAGEKTIGDAVFDQQVGDVRAVRIALIGQSASSTLIDRNGVGIPPPSSPLVRNDREKRQQVMTALTAEQASHAGLSKDIEYTGNFLNDFDMTQGHYHVHQVARVAGIAKGHHLSEMSVLKPDGSRYVYGIPAYNVSQKEVSFNASGLPHNCSNGLVAYQPSANDNNVGNARGIDNYFSSTQLPAFAHSFLLTGVLSADYADLTGDGITDDDGGSAIKINYAKAYDDFQWRVPFAADSATYNEGLKSTPNDDKGSYLCGTKQILYVHSIVTKTHVAEFYLAPRHDGFGVLSENGGLDPSRPLYALHKIVLYSKDDRLRNGAHAIPIKTVHFDYDYSLCQGVPNHYSSPADPVGNRGKLTLQRVYFTYGNLEKGRLNSYMFDYGAADPQKNPTYNVKAYSRWGTYKPNLIISETCPDIGNQTTPLPNSDDPYVEQDKAKADVYASSWELRAITLPSKGTIKIQYESDDYAYVQDKPAMRMFRVLGAANDKVFSEVSTSLYHAPTPLTYQENLWLCLDIPPGVTSKDDFYTKCLAGIDALHFRFLVNIIDDNYEYVSGYAKIDTWDVTDGHAWVKLEATNMRDDGAGSEANPIAKAAWQFARLNMSGKIFAGSDPNGEGESAIRGLLGFLTDIQIMVQGFNRTLKSRGFAQYMVPNKSWVRLNEPSHRRLGGGSRVKKIETSDDWSTMTGASGKEAVYGQEYTYTLSGDTSSTEMTSGVASYEPMVGGDENPFHEPVVYTNKHCMAPDDQLYAEKPFGESLMPDPSIGYRKVTIRDIYRDANNKLQYTATGKVVNEFYTAYDFPVRITQTDLVVNRIKPDFLDKMFRARSLDLTAASQGYAVEKNDMHGKPKSKWVFAQGGATALSGVEYYYQTDPGNPSHLNNVVKVLQENDVISSRIVGRDIDVVLDMRQTQSVIKGTDVNGNLDNFTLAPIPLIPLPSLWGKTSREKTRFRSAVITKSIYEYGLLDSVVAYTDGASVRTSNLALDAETGEVLLTQTSNTYHDPIYNFTYPAHLTYDGMGSAYKNVGLKLPAVLVSSNGNAQITDASKYLVRGDEVLLSNKQAWVLRISGNSVIFVDRWGQAILNGTYDLLVVRSGRRNQQAASVGNVTSLQNPISTGKISNFLGVLNSEAMEYSDIWRTACGIGKIHTLGPIICDTTQASPAALDLEAFLNALSQQGNLDANSLPVDTLLQQVAPGLLATLPIAGPQTPYVYTGNTTHTTLSGSLTAGCVGCTFSLAGLQPSAINWNMLWGFNSIRPDPTTIPPGANGAFVMSAMLKSPSGGSKPIELHGTTNCMDIIYCHPTNVVSECGIVPGNTVNPFVRGMWGNWRLARSHSYLVDRTPIIPASAPDLRKEGSYNGFTPFWRYSVGSKRWYKNAIDWTWKELVTRFSPNGFELENEDALRRFSGVLYGYYNTLPTAVATNARYRWIAFDGFEDYYLSGAVTAGIGKGCLPPRHWEFTPVAGLVSLDSSVSHTGVYSLRLDNNTSASVTRSIETECTPPGSLLDLDNPITPPKGTYEFASDESITAKVFSTGAMPVLHEYELTKCDCNGLFSPEPDREYVFSGWVKEKLASPLDIGTANVTIEIGGTSNTYTFPSSGLVIDGWRRIEGTFQVAPGASNILVTLNPHSSLPVYFDDLRIHPFHASVKSYVYNPYTLRLMAILDERNYATLYEYNYEGQLIRLKKETEHGIETIQESRNELRRY
jgi:hypothetical protein